MKTLAQITKGFGRRSRESVGLAWGILKFDFGDGRFLTIDGTTKPNTVSNDNATADCVISLSLDTLSKMVTGEMGDRDADIAIAGDLRVAMALGPAGTDQPMPRMEERAAAGRGVLLPLPSSWLKDDGT